MSAITTHILDTAEGKPAAGVDVTLKQLNESCEGVATFQGKTDSDCRVTDLMGDTALAVGMYLITFDTQAYFDREDRKSFYPRVDITFRVESADEHYHVPLLISPFGYSTYRGS